MGHVQSSPLGAQSLQLLIPQREDKRAEFSNHRATSLCELKQLVVSVWLLIHLSLLLLLLLSLRELRGGQEVWEPFLLNVASDDVLDLLDH